MATVPKEIDVGDKTTGDTPTPEASCTCVPTEALSTTVTPPTSVPVVRGVNVTVTVHDLPLASAPPQGDVVPGTVVKYPPPEILPIVIEAAVPFLTVRSFETDVFNATFPKLRLAGLKVSGEVAPFCPVPLSPPTTGFPEDVGLMVSAPLMIPLVVGVKLTEIVHLDFEARVPVHGLVPLPTAE